MGQRAAYRADMRGSMTHPTTTIRRVEIMRSGGPYNGTGSADGGDYFTDADLDAIAEDTSRMLAARELDPPLKLGHNREQRIARDSGLVLEDGRPALGWISSVYRDGSGLFADVRDVPSKLAKLAPKAWAKRSVELRPLASQVDGGKRRFVVAGLALLGEKLPAMRTLDDLAALYHDEPAEGGDDAPDFGVLYLHGGQPLVLGANTASAAVSFTSTTADTSAPTTPAAPARGNPNPPEEAAAVTFTDEQLGAIRSALGLADDATPEGVIAAVQARVAAPTPTPDAPDGVVAMSADEAAELRQMAQAGVRAETELKALRISTKLDAAQRDGRISAAQRAGYEKLYAANEDAADDVIATLPERAFGAVAGSDDNPVNQGDLDRLYSDFAGMLGVASED